MFCALYRILLGVPARCDFDFRIAILFLLLFSILTFGSTLALGSQDIREHLLFSYIIHNNCTLRALTRFGYDVHV